MKLIQVDHFKLKHIALIGIKLHGTLLICLILAYKPRQGKPVRSNALLRDPVYLVREDDKRGLSITRATLIRYR